VYIGSAGRSKWAQNGFIIPGNLLKLSKLLNNLHRRSQGGMCGGGARAPHGSNANQISSVCGC